MGFELEGRVYGGGGTEEKEAEQRGEGDVRDVRES